jgi:hypothetical protein
MLAFKDEQKMADNIHMRSQIMKTKYKSQNISTDGNALS